MTELPTDVSPDDLPFPPLGNRGVWSIASADVGPDPAFQQLAVDAAQVPDGPCSDLVAPFERWLAAAARTANDQRFRFDLTGLHADGLSPLLGDLASIGASAFVHQPGVAAGRATAKLVVLIGVGGDDAVELGAHGLDATVSLSHGILAVAPAFAPLRFTPATTASLRVVAVSVEGPAFR